MTSKSKNKYVFFYQFFLTILIIISPLIIIVRIIKNKEDKFRFVEKFCIFQKKDQLVS